MANYLDFLIAQGLLGNQRGMRPEPQGQWLSGANTGAFNSSPGAAMMPTAPGTPIAAPMWLPGYDSATMQAGQQVPSAWQSATPASGQPSQWGRQLAPAIRLPGFSDVAQDAGTPLTPPAGQPSQPTGQIAQPQQQIAQTKGPVGYGTVGTRLRPALTSFAPRGNGVGRPY